MKDSEDKLGYAKYFDENRLLKKLKNYSGSLSVNILYNILILFCLTTDKTVPYKTRIVFIAALGYLIFPTDLISDFLPGLGFTDDAALIAYAISNATNYISPQIREKAFEMLGKIIGSKRLSNVQLKNLL